MQVSPTRERGIFPRWRVERTNRVRRRIANNFFSNGTIWDILGHPALEQPPNARTANPTRLSGAQRSIASEAYDPFETMQANRL